MKTLGLFLVLQLCCLAVDGLFLQDRRVIPAKSDSNPGPLQPKKTGRRKVIPKYILRLYEENQKHGRNVHSLYCIFPSKFRFDFVNNNYAWAGLSLY